MAEQRKAGSRKTFVDSLVKDPKSPPRTTLLTGYVGAAADGDSTRIYFDPELNEAVDVKNADVLHVADSDDSSPLATSFVWVRQGAEMRPVTAQATVSASYLSGRIAEENLAATQAYYPGGIATPIPPSIVCPTRILQLCPTRYAPHCPTLPPYCVTITRPWLCRTTTLSCRSLIGPCVTLPGKCPSLAVLCTAPPTGVVCPTASPLTCGQPSAVVICPTLAACPSAVDACPSAPGGCGTDITTVYNPTIVAGGGLNLWG